MYPGVRWVLHEVKAKTKLRVQQIDEEQMSVKDKRGESSHWQEKPSFWDAGLTPEKRNGGRWSWGQRRMEQVSLSLQCKFDKVLANPGWMKDDSLEESSKGRNDQAWVSLPCSVTGWRHSDTLQGNPGSAAEGLWRLTPFLAAGPLSSLKGYCSSVLAADATVPSLFTIVLVRISYILFLLETIVSEPAVLSTYPLSQWVVQMKPDALSRDKSSSWQIKSN